MEIAGVNGGDTRGKSDRDLWRCRSVKQRISDYVCDILNHRTIEMSDELQ